MIGAKLCAEMIARDGAELVTVNAIIFAALAVNGHIYKIAAPVKLSEEPPPGDCGARPARARAVRPRPRIGGAQP
jgi:hypothetical protein